MDIVGKELIPFIRYFYRVFDIESESRSPPRIAINDQNCKKPSISSLLLVEFHLMFTMPGQIPARSSYRSLQKFFIRMIEQRYMIKFFSDEGCTGIEIHQRLKNHHGDSAMSRSEVYRWIRDIKGGGCGEKNGLRNDFKSRKDARRRTFRGNPTQD
jgi:hypothetical protein